MKRGLAALAFFAAAACAPSGAPLPPEEPRSAVAKPVPDRVPPSPLGVLPVRETVPAPPARAPAAPAFSPFGRVTLMEVRVALWSLPPLLGRPVPPQQHYERWRERRRASVGYGYLSILDLSVDERFLLVASEEEARLRTYEFSSLRPLASLPVDGYAKFGRGDFVFLPVTGAPPPAIFAGETGLWVEDTLAPHAGLVSPEPADTLRWTDDHQVLGATLSVIPAQRSRIVFYRVGTNLGLEPLLLVEFAERVEEWDLDAEKKRLAVTYYPSNQVEVLDLAARSVLWVAPSPEYSNSVDFSSDDQRLAVGGSSVVVFDVRSGRPIAEDAHFGNNIHRVRFSPSGDALAVSSYEGKVRLFDVTRPGPSLPLRKVLRHTGTANVYALAFSADGSELVSASGDRTVRVWGE